jgi:hypothetical protein
VATFNGSARAHPGLGRVAGDEQCDGSLRGAATPHANNPPVVSHVAPAPASVVGAAAALSHRVTDTEALSGVVLVARFADRWETVYVGVLDGEVWQGSFSPLYSASTIASVVDGFDFSLVRAGGWGAPGSVFWIQPVAFDGLANE